MAMHARLHLAVCGLFAIALGASAVTVPIPRAPLPATALPNNTACQALPPPDPERLVQLMDTGATDPRLLSTLVPAVDYARLFPDSKTIVDMPLKAPPDQVYAAYQALNLPDPLTDPEAFATNATINSTLADFVSEWMSEPGTEVIAPAINFTEGALPIWIESIEDPDARTWAEDLFFNWGELTRVVDPDVAANQELYTFLPVPNPFVIPGSRFREGYKWDSAWIVKGLLASELPELATNMVLNFVSLIERIGHVPNGFRTYYVNRGQPTVTSQMAAEVYADTGDATFLQQVLPALLREYTFWVNPPKQVSVMMDGQQYQLSRYYAAYDSPRPESFREDADTARQAGFDPANPTEETRQLYLDLASGAESGWDYSTRWLEEGSTNLTTIRTTRVIPADLQAFLFQTEANIARFADALGCSDLAEEFAQNALTRQAAMMETMWDPEAGQWFDLICEPGGLVPAPETAPSGAEVLYLDAAVNPEAEAQAMGDQQEVCNATRSSVVAASNWIPLWAGVVAPNSSEAQQAVESFRSSGFNQVGGVPVTLTESGQQWDAPNVWPPVMDMLIEAFAAVPGAEDLAAQLAQRYLDTALATWKATGSNFEKFNSTTVGRPGGGGEYEVVTGFGWTNGVALSLLRSFGFSSNAAAPMMGVAGP